MIVLRTLLRVLLAAAMGACIGLAVAYVTGLSRLPPVGSVRLPYLHVVPKYENAVSLRFAMVHDVIHERLPRHGLAYYKERNRRNRQALDELRARPDVGQPSQSYFDLLDDLAVGLEMAGEHEEAIRLMRDKLQQQAEFDISREKQYSTYANLGTFLILGPFRQVRPGNVNDKKVLREGLKCIQTAIEINPDSHFGRELWQVVIIEYLIALYDNPQLLLQFDMVGNRLDRSIVGLNRSPMSNFDAKYGSYHGGPLQWGARFGGVALSQEAADYLKDPDSWARHKGARQGIMLVGAENGWAKAVVSAHSKPVPFDEPTLGIVGMWRLGVGAHPYFAVALGETMLRIGQDYIAWSAFERAARLANLAWPDLILQQSFTDHCRKRQATIEALLPADEVNRLRTVFDAELALGTDYQKDYQRFEEESIAAGKSIEDPRFYDDFQARRRPISSSVGEADWFHTSESWMQSWMAVTALLFAGISALAAALRMPRNGTLAQSSRAA